MDKQRIMARAREIMALRPGTPFMEAVKQAEKQLAAADAIENFDFEAHREWGTGAEAEQWLNQSGLPAHVMTDLKRFVQAYPALAYFRLDEDALDHDEQMHAVTFPDWYRGICLSFNFGRADDRLLMKFRSFNPRETPGRSDLWFQPAPGYASHAEREKLTADANFALFPIMEEEQGDVMLAINLNGEDEQIYLYNREDLMSWPLGRQAVFPSYAGMLAQVQKMKGMEGMK